MEILTQYILPIIGIIILIILFFTVKNLLPSYFKEKGKNLATREDIAGLTTIVESVKHDFTKETEKLKSNLQFLVNVQGNLVSEERFAIIDFNEKYFTWQNMLLDSGFSQVDMFNIQEVDKFMTDVNKAYQNVVNSETRFGLFIDDENLIEKTHDLKIETLKLVPIVSQYLLKMKLNNLDLDALEDEEDSPEKYEKINAKRAERGPEYDIYSKALLEHFEKLASVNKDFQTSCREYLYDLINPKEIED